LAKPLGLPRLITALISRGVCHGAPLVIELAFSLVTVAACMEVV
jgi:hypothetical protein